MYFEDSILINAPAPAIWECLVNAERVKTWMHNEPLEMSGKWSLGQQLVITGSAGGHAFENQLRVVEFSAPRILSYTYWTSLSGLEDVPANRSRVRFHLETVTEGILLHVSQDYIKTEADFGHVRFYWKGTLQEIKKLAEG